MYTPALAGSARLLYLLALPIALGVGYVAYERHHAQPVVASPGAR